MLTIFVSGECFALVPLESLILGDLSATQARSEKDPLSNVFHDSRAKNGDEAAQELVALYRGFVDEGENLQQFCALDRDNQLRYTSSAHEEQVTRTVISSLQYVGLDLLVRSLPAYAHKLGWSRDDFEQYATGLVGNWCSQNLTIISHKELKRNLLAKWDEKEQFSLPSIDGNPYFPQKLLELIEPEQRNAREFYWSTELFKSFCSWSNLPEDMRLLLPLVHDPMIMSYIARQVGGKRIAFNPTNKTIRMDDYNQTIRTSCRGLICRRSSEQEFKHLTPISAGTPNHYTDVRRLYCHRLRDAKNNAEDLEPRVRDILERRTLEENLLLSGQFKALLTGVPNFLIWSNTYDQGQAMLRASFDQKWNQWAQESISKLGGEISYEEPLTVELVERELYFNPYRKKFAVQFDVNQGEFDRVNRIAGKITASFDLKITHKMLHWLRRSWRALDPTQKLERDDIINRFKSYIKNDVASAREKFVIPPWQGDIEAIIVTELLEQFSKFDGKWDYPQDGITTIPVHLNYGPFALRFMHYRHQVRKRASNLSLNENTTR